MAAQMAAPLCRCWGGQLWVSSLVLSIQYRGFGGGRRRWPGEGGLFLVFVGTSLVLLAPVDRSPVFVVSHLEFPVLGALCMPASVKLTSGCFVNWTWCCWLQSKCPHCSWSWFSAGGGSSWAGTGLKIVWKPHCKSFPQCQLLAWCFQKHQTSILVLDFPSASHWCGGIWAQQSGDKWIKQWQTKGSG